MIRVEAIIGNLTRGFVPPPGSVIDELRLTRWDAQKRRLRTRTRDGRDLAISLANANALSDGDVLHCDAAVTIIASVQAGDVLVLRLAPGDDSTTLALNALRLGHVLGNQHWPMRLQLAPDGNQDMEIIVPLSLDQKVVEAVVHAHRLEGVTYAFRLASPDEVLDAPPVPFPHANDHAYASSSPPSPPAASHTHSHDADGALEHPHVHD